MNSTSKLFTFDGYMGRKDFIQNFLICILSYIPLAAIGPAIEFLFGHIIGEGIAATIRVAGIVVTLFGVLMVLSSNAIRRVRDIFGGPISNNFSATLWLVALVIPYLNLIALIFYSVKPGLPILPYPFII
jgi:uncharacterized membrane protein YhaH (DUF805 family)